MHHEPLAKAAGINDEQIEYIRKVPACGRQANINKPPKGLFSTEQEIVLEIVDHNTLNVKIPKTVFDKAMDHFDNKRITEIVVTCSAYNMVSRFLVGMDVMGAADIEVGMLKH